MIARRWPVIVNRTGRTKEMNHQWIGVLIITAGCQAACNATKPSRFGNHWRSEEVGAGVVWWSREEVFNGAPQSIHVVEVQARPKSTPPENLAPVEIVTSKKGKAPLSAMAAATRAIAAVNGGYFDRDGKPVGLLVVDGESRATNPGNMPPRGVVAFTIDRGIHFGRVSPGDTGVALASGGDAMGAGPLLIENGKVLTDPRSEGFVDSKFLGRNPRTAIGRTAEGTILLVVIDGRRAGAAGMSIDELRTFMLQIGCVDALNLDGGGSTTLWIRGKPPRGIANTVSDPAGERAVANGLLIFTKDVTIFDDASPDFGCFPPELWSLQSGAADSFDDAYQYSRGGPARAVWTVKAEFPGRYDVYARWPGGKFTKNAVFEILCDETRTVGAADQSQDPGTWRKIGEFSCDRADGSVVITLSSGDGLPIAADAIRIEEK